MARCCPTCGGWAGGDESTSRAYGATVSEGVAAMHDTERMSLLSRNELLDQLAEHNMAAKDAERYQKYDVLNKARSRLLALILTLTVEILPAFVILNGATRLTLIIGQRKAALFSGFITIVSAISGNVGLQSSSLTTRAISHGFVTPRLWYRYLTRELATAALLALLLGSIAFIFATCLSRDVFVGLCIGFAQALAMVIAGLTGTMAPIIFKFIFAEDPGCWAGPLETAIQDVVGTACLFYLSFYFLEFVYGPVVYDVAV